MSGVDTNNSCVSGCSFIRLGSQVYSHTHNVQSLVLFSSLLIYNTPAATVNEDYLEFEMNITFVSGQNATGDNQQCFYVVLLDDNVLEYNETFDILIRPSPEDEDIVNITNGIITVTIEEDATDSK